MTESIMNESKLETRSISELEGKNFFIPNYQRGYRWTERQAQDLLDDIQEFSEKKQKDEKEKDEWYCLQPVVVKSRREDTEKEEKEFKPDDIKVSNYKVISDTDIKLNVVPDNSFEVLDGQQRLTTIFLILKYLEDIEPKTKLFTISYETREKSEDFF